MASIQLSTNKVPISGELKEVSGLPLVAVLQPLTRDEATTSEHMPFTSDIARCQECLGYVNKLCNFGSTGWSCSLCGMHNDYTTVTNHRYIDAAYRATLPELQSPVVEAISPLIDQDTTEGENEVYEAEAQLMCIALVDTCCDVEFLELTRSAILAGLEALPHGAQFGLISFSNDIVLHEICGNGSITSLRHVPIEPNGNKPTSMDLHEALPLDNLLLPVTAGNKSAIAAALDALQPQEFTNTRKKRALGEALQATLRYISGSAGTDTSSIRPFGARLLVFLSGPPNYGRGSVLMDASLNKAEPAVDYSQEIFFPELAAWTVVVPPTMASRQSTIQPVQSLIDLSHAAEELGVSDVSTIRRNIQAEQFYREAAAGAAALGVCVDIYAVSQHYVGLDMLRPISMLSGGGVALYTGTVEESTLPQDVYKRLGEPLTMQCMMRLRTCPELQVVGAIGERLHADAMYEGLYHAACCHPYDAFAVELKHSKSSGFASRSTPVFQLVFQYQVLVPSSSSHNSLVLQKRTRIVTVAYPIADSVVELYKSCNASAVTFALVQEVTAAGDESTRKQARKALESWLSTLTACYHDWITIGEYYKQEDNSVGSDIDAAFNEIEAMQQLPRAMYAICNGPLLGGGLHDGNSHPDSTSMVRTLCSTLPPEELSAAIYPQLSSWSSPDECVLPRHSLSSTAIKLSSQPIYLLDTYSSLIMYYTAAAVGDFPPPATSAIRQHVAAVRQARRVTPRVLMVREGDVNASSFTEWLIEDAGHKPSNGLSENGASAGEYETFVQFLKVIKERASQFYK